MTTIKIKVWFHFNTLWIGATWPPPVLLYSERLPSPPPLILTCLLASTPTSLSPSLVKATTEGVVLDPSAFSITLGFLPSITATHEFVVPRSIPITVPFTSELCGRREKRTLEHTHSKHGLIPSPSSMFWSWTVVTYTLSSYTCVGTDFQYKNVMANLFK